MYVDVHCHLDHEALAEKLHETIAACHAAGVKAIVSNGTNAASNRAVLALAERYPLVRPAYGIYPTEPTSVENDAAEIAWIREQALHSSHPPVGIGEIGLDGVETVTERQRERFRSFLALATELRLPVIIHSRKAEQAVFDELLASGHTGIVVLHCFGGAKKLVREGVKRHYFFSIPASITRAEHFQMIAEFAPLSCLLTETDSPYLSPKKEHFPNTPASVVTTVERIAAIKKITVEECRQALFMNYQRVFGGR
jgi:TatD DNase family protein